MRIEEITLEAISVEPEGGHEDGSLYNTISFRVLDADHPNSFVVPISVNADQYPPEQIEDHARFIFHRLIRSLAEATKPWDRFDPRPLS